MLILFAKCLNVASLCSSGWQESFGMMVSEVLGCLYMSNDILFVAFVIARSRKFSLLSCSRSNETDIHTSITSKESSGFIPVSEISHKQTAIARCTVR